MIKSFLLGLLLLLCYSLFPVITHAQTEAEETVAEAVQAARDVYYGLNADKDLFQPFCATDTLFGRGSAGFAFREYRGRVAFEFYFGQDALLRFIYVSAGLKKLRFYFTWTEYQGYQLPVLCRFIDERGTIYEGEELRESREKFELLFNQAHELRKYASLNCEQFKSAILLDKEAQQMTDRGYEEGYMLNKVDHLAAELSYDDPGEDPEEMTEASACWDHTTFVISQATSDTMMIKREHGCDPGCMVYTTATEATYFSPASSYRLHVQQTINYSMGNLHLGLHGPDNTMCTLTESTKTLFSGDQLVASIREVYVNGVALVFEVE